MPADNSQAAAAELIAAHIRSLSARLDRLEGRAKETGANAIRRDTTATDTYTGDLPDYLWVKFNIEGADEPIPAKYASFPWWRQQELGTWKCVAAIPPDLNVSIPDYFPKASVNQTYVAAFSWHHSGFEDNENFMNTRRAQLMDALERAVATITQKARTYG